MPPGQVIRDLGRCFTSFFWRQLGGSHYHRCSWKSLTLPKKKGGVGFLHLDLMVCAASVKLWWNFGIVSSPWGDLIRATVVGFTQSPSLCRPGILTLGSACLVFGMTWRWSSGGTFFRVKLTSGGIISPV